MDRGDTEEDLLPLQKNNRKVFPGALELHPNEKAIILHYKTKVLLKSQDGATFYDEKETKDGTKVIKVKLMNGDTDINQLANSIIEKNKFLTVSRISELSTLLYKLQSRTLDYDVKGSFRNSDSFANLDKSIASVPVASMLDSDKVWLQKQYDSLKSQSNIIPQNLSLLPSKTGPVSLDNLDTYLEDLYEDIPQKLVSTSAILELARTPSNIPLLLSHSSLLSALARVLREDGRKSIDLSLSLMSIFYVFSFFSSNHSLLTVNKIGDLSLRILETEAKRWLVLQDDLKCSEEKAAAKKSDKSIQQAYQTDLAQFKTLFTKQNQLLFVTLSLLLNLAEDLSIEVKMVKRDILKYLLEILSRKSIAPAVSNGTCSDLVLHTVLLFLSKLGIFQENKDILITAGRELVQELSRVTSLPSTPIHLKTQSLKFLLNLSHDDFFRSHIIASTLPTFLIDSLSSSAISKTSPLYVLHLQLLYQCTLDASSRSLPFTTPTLTHCLRLLLEEKGAVSLEGESGQISLYILSLLINLSASPEHIPMISSSDKGGGALKFLFKKGLKSPHPLIFKIIRNVSCSADVTIKYKFLDYIDELVSLFIQTACDPKHDDLFIEILGILSNLSIPDFDYAKLITSFNLLDILCKIMTKSLQTPSRLKEDPEGDSALDLGDDILLESINLLSTFSLDEAVAPLVGKTLLLDMVVESMIVKDEDDSILLQACYCIHQYLQYPKTCQYLIKIPHLVDHLIDLLYDTNPQIRQVTDACLEIISQIDGEWETQLKRQKFAWHNSEWIKMITTMNGHEDHDDSHGFDEHTF